MLLPIHQVLPDIQQALVESDTALLQASPGAGKTTVVPLALLEAPWAAVGKILLIEPRRLAAKAAAERMAAQLGEPVGETVGYRVRLEKKVSSCTRIEVQTEGMFLRLLQNNMDLEGVSAVIFDEFHERNLDADQGLAQVLYLRALFRSVKEGAIPLKLLLMSATLDTDKCLALLVSHDEATRLIQSEGRQYDVQIRYSRPTQLADNVVDLCVPVIWQALSEHTGNCLVFLPGKSEIEHTLRRLTELQSSSDNPALKNVMVELLHGQLDLDAQKRAISANEQGLRKVVLATAIAESSITVEGIEIVIDSGRARQTRFNARTGISRLETTWVSQASAAQRTGRAGRLGPGLCYRLWSETQHAQLAKQSEAEILRTDLSHLMLSLLNWGIDDLQQLSWMDEPPAAHMQVAIDLLVGLHAIDSTGPSGRRLSAYGKLMAELPAHPRIAHLLCLGAIYGQVQSACCLAAILDSPPLRGQQGVDLEPTFYALTRSDKRISGHALSQIDKIKSQFQRIVSRLKLEAKASAWREQLKMSDQLSIGALLAHAFPDRIAKSRTRKDKEYLLSNGRGASLTDNDALLGHEWLVVTDLGGHQKHRSDRIFAAWPLNQAQVERELMDLITTEAHIEWHAEHDKFIAEERVCLGAIQIKQRAITDLDGEVKKRAIAGYLAKTKLKDLTWPEALKQFIARVKLAQSLMDQLPDQLSEADERAFKDLDFAELEHDLEDWLLPAVNVEHIRRKEDFAKIPLLDILKARLNWQQLSWLNTLLPESIVAPSGTSVKIDYQQSPPVMAVRLQEMFGCTRNPTVALGRVPLMLHLLSPARRPLQVTQDLEGFWGGSYHDVKKDMKGRYPKHHWPDNPLLAAPTARPKPRKLS